MYKSENYRLIPVLISGRGWAVELRAGSKRAGTYRSALVSEPVYTLAQAQAFVSNNRARDLSGGLMKHKHDMEGLHDHLFCELGIIKRQDKIVFGQ